jgi:hypothetical protein
MSYSKKKSSALIYLLVALLVALIVAGVAIFFVLQPPPEGPAVPGVKAGDVFTYSLQGRTTFLGEEAIQPDGFEQYNQTDYYQVHILNVEDSVVYFTTTWRFLNGTEIFEQAWIDLSFGNKTDSTTTFWPIYGSDLKAGNKLRPLGADGIIVEKTDVKTYASEARERNYWTLSDSFYDSTDPTMSSTRNELNSVYFDRQTGMLESLTNVQEYNTPAMLLVTTWQLVDSSVWQVK